MKKREIDTSVRQAFSKVVPDVLDAVLLDCKQQEGKVIVLSENTVKRPMTKKIIGIAAAFVVVFAAIMGYMVYSQNYKIASTISLDVNPSIEIFVNQKEKVLDVRANNEDGKTVIGDMDFKGNSLDITVNALIGSMLKNGYINELANSILVSVDTQDPQQSAQLQQKLTDEINTLLQTNTFSGAVLSQTIQQDESLQQLADQYGITLGKAQLINQIIEKNALYTFADLVPLSINELNLLSESGGSQLENVSSVGTASDKAYIGRESAMQIAFEDAGVSQSDVQKLEIEMDYEYGVMVYEIEFDVNGMEYDYDINATTGEILKNQQKQDDDSWFNQNTQTSGSGQSGQNSSQTSQGTTQGNYIGRESAQQIALEHAGVAESSLRQMEIELDEEHGVMVYEVDFEAGGYEYSYDIDATTGQVLKYDKEWED